MRPETVLGWDLGGEHLKVAAVDAAGRVLSAAQFPCPLWQGLPELDRALQLALAHCPPAQRHALTMTGELVDLFGDRAEGVASLIARFGAHVPLERALVFASGGRFLSPARAVKHSDAVASASVYSGSSRSIAGSSAVAVAGSSAVAVAGGVVGTLGCQLAVGSIWVGTCSSVCSLPGGLIAGLPASASPAAASSSASR